MIYPIVAIGDVVLKKKAEDISLPSADLPTLIQDMFETMYHARGVGLAAPQIGLGIRLFVIDSSAFEDEEEKGVKKAFINPVIEEEWGEEWAYEEGCLSIPGVRADVVRPSTIRIRYTDEKGVVQTEVFEGLTARVIQHEYDHIEGVLFVDHLSGLKKRLLKGKLINISKGICDVAYRMKFPLKK